MTTPRILLTGASGYIGGSVLSSLLSSDLPLLKGSAISVLVRHEDQAEALAKVGVIPVLFNGLDDLEMMRKIASTQDLIINTAMSFHGGSAKAMIQGLGDRKKQTGQEVHFIHTSGTSNLGDNPITGAFIENHIFSDKEDIFSYEKYRESITQYDQRTSDITVVETGLEVGVKTYIIMPPLIYGQGSGLFNTLSIQIPLLIRQAIKSGRAEIIGPGDQVWDHVHISDLTELYTIFIHRILTTQPLTSGPRGIYFAGSGEHSWYQLATGIANAGVSLGVLESAQVQHLQLEDAATKWLGGNQTVAELGFASTSRTRPDLGRKIGWEPKKTLEDFERNFLVEFGAIYALYKDSGGNLQGNTWLLEHNS
ncbi:NAD dependent epimerase/dehydratase family protein [Trichoderma velutinum]